MGRIIDYVRGSTVGKLIAANAAVWLALRAVAVVLRLCGVHHPVDVASQWVEFPADPSLWGVHFYGMVTYMFAQYGILHLLFNMLWLYWFGSVFMEISSGRQLVWLYVGGGVAGALFFAAAFNLIPPLRGSDAWLIGSSASVLAIVTATAILVPAYPIRLLVIGTVQLRWIAIVAVGLVLLTVSGGNAGGEIAHLGGIAAGALYGCLRRFRGVDLADRMNRAAAFVVGKRGGLCGKPTRSAKEDREELDRILDKIKLSGYGSLSAAERRRLFEVSRRVK